MIGHRGRTGNRPPHPANGTKGLQAAATLVFFPSFMSSPEQPARDETGHPPASRQPLYVRMYFDPAFTELTRYVGYGGKPADKIQRFVESLKSKYGARPASEAVEALTAIETINGATVVQL
ncbi:MAG: hypothetical protein AB7K24_22540, partial [Gemmataceae bacterium]